MYSTYICLLFPLSILYFSQYISLLSLQTLMGLVLGYNYNHLISACTNEMHELKTVLPFGKAYLCRAQSEYVRVHHTV